jgi:hypothetical protein
MKLLQKFKKLYGEKEIRMKLKSWQMINSRISIHKKNAQ